MGVLGAAIHRPHLGASPKTAPACREMREASHEHAGFDRRRFGSDPRFPVCSVVDTKPAARAVLVQRRQYLGPARGVVEDHLGAGGPDEGLELGTWASM
jgi:hypothetical protein